MLPFHTRLVVLLAAMVLNYLPLAAQSTDELLSSALDLQRRAQYDSAITIFSKVISKDPKNINALFRRGYCALALERPEQTIADLSNVIKQDSSYLDAYYFRANAYAELKRFEEAKLDAEILVGRNEKYEGALCLRGRIHSMLGHKKEACEDYRRAIELGDQRATQYKNEYCGNEQGKGESLMLYWPEDENWKVANSQDTEGTMILELVRNNENLGNWTEMGSMVSIRGLSKGQTTSDIVMKALYEQTLKHSSQAKLAVVDRDDSAEFPWIIFSIEAPNYDDALKPESWLWYVVLGKDAVYTNFRAVHVSAIPGELKTKWMNFFKTGKILYK